MAPGCLALRIGCYMFKRLGLRPLLFLPLFLAACATAHPPAASTAGPAAHQHQVAVSGDHFDYGHPYVIETSRPLQCVAYARMQSGIEIYGDANRWWAKAAGHYRRGTHPEVGSVMVLKGYGTDRRGHLTVVRKIQSSRILIIDHANWMGRGEINRNVPVEDVSPGNDWSQVRVWYIPGTRWGSRVNTVEGFIYPDVAVASR
jgi:CHAP domain